MISIIIPIRNEIKHIGDTLDSILQQSIEEVIEILVADGMSTDGTRKKIKDLETTNSNIQLIDNPEQIVSTGFNRALTKAKGDIIIRVDGHCEIALDYIQNCLITFENTKADCVGGATDHIASGIIGNSITIAQSSLFGVGGVDFRQNQANGKYVDTLAFGAYKREVFEKIGGYDEELVRNQDDEFNFRLIQNGGKIWLDPNIKSKYYPRTSLNKLFKQYFQYGFYKIRVFQKRGGIASWRQLIPILFIIFLLIAIGMVKFGWVLPIKFILGTYFSLSFLFTIKEFLKNNSNFNSILLLPITFFIIHFAYGLGSFFGLFYFMKSWKDTKIKDSTFNKELFYENTLS